jgi:glutamyl-tRNA synthetase
MNQQALPTGRLAPSPTGAQHIGNARTFLIAWLMARSGGGRVLLRLEDIDSPRIKPGAAEQTLTDLKWLDLDWDGEPIVQTSRLSLYEAALRSLRERELVYPCTCTRGDIDRAASAPHADHEEPAYPGTCAGRMAGDAAGLTATRFAWRFRTAGKAYTFDDGFHGHQQIDLATAGGDFVVWKSAGTPAYQLAVVVDDAAQEVTEVVRGDDLLSSTPRQLALYEALGLRPPHFTHVPLVVGPDGRRLAKRHGDTRLSSLRKAGVSAEQLLGLMAYSCGWATSMQPTRPADLLSLFDLDAIPRKPWVLTADALRGIGYQPT